MLLFDEQNKFEEKICKKRLQISIVCLFDVEHSRTGCDLPLSGNNESHDFRKL